MWRKKFYGIIATFTAGSSGTFYNFSIPFFHADSKKPSSADQLTLQSVQVFFRHGARTPLRPIPFLEEAEWPKDKLMASPDYPSVSWKLQGIDGRKMTRKPNDDKFQRTVFKGGAFAGHLTKVGKQQMFDLGRRLRHDYLDNKRLDIDPTFADSEVFIRTTNILRTVESAQWLINGMFHVEKREKDKPVVMYTDLDEEEILYPNVNFCIRLKNVNKRFYKAVDDIPGLEKNRLKHATLLKYNPEQNNNKKLDYQELRDELAARLVHGIYVPDEVHTMIDDVNRHATEMLRLMVCGPDKDKEDHVLSLSCGPVVHMVVQNMETVARGRETHKLCLFSAHDSTLIALLCCMGIFDAKWPPYAADVRFELYQDKKGGEWVRVLYLGRPQKIRGSDGAEFISLDQFKKAMSRYSLSLKQYKEACGTKADEEEGGEVMDVVGGSTK